MVTKEQTKKSQVEQAKEEQNELLTVHEVASHLRVDDTTVRRWIKNGALEAIGLPSRGKRQAYRIRHATLEALLNESPIRKQAS